MSITSNKAILFIAAIIYTLMPFDAVPDMLGIIGRIDELIVYVIIYWYWQRLSKNRTTTENQRYRDSTHQQPQQDSSPYQVLGVPKDASPAEIEKRYRQLIAQYHPDKVEHLGDEFRLMAHEKTVAIQTAYQKLMK